MKRRQDTADSNETDRQDFKDGDRLPKQRGNQQPAFIHKPLAPDGKRIVALMPAEAPEGQKAQHHVIFLENFFDEVRRRTATQSK